MRKPNYPSACGFWPRGVQVGALTLVLLLRAGSLHAGPYTIPPGAPAITLPLPLTPGVGSTFNPLSDPTLGIAVVPESVAAPVTTLWVVDLGRFGPGAWSAASPVVIQDTPHVDKVQFRVPLNFDPAPISGSWNLWVVFGGSPWGENVAFKLGNSDFFHISPAIPEPFALASYPFDLVLTDISHTVIDVLDPVLITGSAGQLATAGLRPTVGSLVVPDSGGSFFLVALTTAALMGMTQRWRARSCLP